jgi:hypothetical protein
MPDMKFLMVFIVAGMALSVAGCFGDKATVKISGDADKISITAPPGYDSLAVAEGHCRSFKKKAVFNGRGEGAGQDQLTFFRCMVR